MAEISVETAGAITARRAEVVPTAGRAQEIYDRRAEMIRESDSPLALLAGEEAPTKKYIDGVVKLRIGTPDIKGARRLNADQRDRVTRVDSATDILIKIAKGENLDIVASIPSVELAVKSLISQHPNFLAQYSALTPPQKVKFVENLLKDSNTRSEVIKLLGERIKIEDLGEDDDITKKREEVDRLDTKKKELEQEKTDLETKKNQSENELSKFESSLDATTGAITQGEYVQKLSGLQAKINPLTKQSESLASEVEILNASIHEIQQARAQFVTGRVTAMSADVISILGDYDKQIQALKNELSNKKNAQNYTEQQLAKANQENQAVEARRETLQASIQSISERLATISGEISEITPDLISARAELRASLSRKDTLEEDFVKKVESILAESLKSTIVSDMLGTSNAEKAIDEKAKNDAKSQLEETMREAIIARYQDGADINWANFRTDYYVTYFNNGPDAIITGFLPAGTSLDTLKTDQPELYKELRDDLNKKMARLRLQEPREGMGRLGQTLLGPKPVSRGEIQAIVNRFGESTFTEALQTNAAFRTLVEKAKTDKVLNTEGKITEGIKKLPMGKILLILAALLGIGIFKGAST